MGNVMESVAFWFVMLAGSLLVLWYVNIPILIVFFALTRYCLKRFSGVRCVNGLALSLTGFFTIPLSWISMTVLYRLGKIDFP